jgi:hypothetical protein
MVVGEGVPVRNTNDGMPGSTGIPPCNARESYAEHERGGLAVFEQVYEMLCDDAFIVVDGEEPKESFVIGDIADIESDSEELIISSSRSMESNELCIRDDEYSFQGTTNLRAQRLPKWQSIMDLLLTCGTVRMTVRQHETVRGFLSWMSVTNRVQDEIRTCIRTTKMKIVSAIHDFSWSSNRSPFKDCPSKR